jgi:hypothetical protein
MKGDTRADQSAVDVVGEIAASVDRDCDGAEVGEGVIEAESSSGSPTCVVDLTLFTTYGAVDG